MSSSLGDKKGRSADSSDLTKLQRESAVLAAYTTYTGLSVNKKARQQVGADRKFTLGRGGLTLISDSTTGFTLNPITGAIVYPPYGAPAPPPPIVYVKVYAIPIFSAATFVSGVGSIGDPYIVSSGGKQYSVKVTSVAISDFNTYGGQNALNRGQIANRAWQTSAGAYDSSGNLDIAESSSITINGSPYPAQYIIVTAPDAFVLTEYILVSIFGDSSPVDWVLAGSINGTTFTLIDSKTNQSFITGGTIQTFTLPNNTAAYTTYALGFTKMQGILGLNQPLRLDQLNLMTLVPS
jgi:hypothetical protein